MSWHAAVAEAISNATGSAFVARASHSVSGGDIHAASILQDGAQRFFVKTNRADRLALFEAESAGLAALAATGAVRVPQPVCAGVAAGQAFLVLEYLELRGHGDAARRGEQLAQLHRIPQPRFGWPRDNWIGTTQQLNAWRDDWIAFWREQRLGFQFRLAAQNGYGGALQRDGEMLLARLDTLFDAYVPAPSLLHGDLWGGNHGYLADGSYDLSCPSGHRKSESPCGTPVIFDPASYVGDRECDLAMSELFGGFAPEFYAAYRASWPLDAGYGVRKTLYNLYHILNHANLFGGSYAAQAARMTAQLLAQIR